MTLTAGGQMEAIAWNTSQGFSTALSAFTAQNYAARKKERILTAYHTTLKMTSIIGVLCTLLFVFYGSEVFSLIVPEQAAYEAGGIFDDLHDAGDYHARHVLRYRPNGSAGDHQHLV